jgi:hypothetical protein
MTFDRTPRGAFAQANAKRNHASCHGGITRWGVGALAALAAVTAGCSASPGEVTGGGAPPAAAGQDEDARVKEFLDGLYKPGDVRHSYTDESGQFVDCVDYYAEPGVKAAMARGIMFSEPEHLEVPDEIRTRWTATHTDTATAVERALRDAQEKLRPCPVGTVPHLRITTRDIANRGGLDAFLAPPHRTKPRINASATGQQETPVRAKPPGNVPLDCTPRAVGGVPEIPDYAHTIVDWEGILTSGGFSTMSLDTPNIFPTVSGDGGNHYISQTWISNGSGDYMQGCTTNCWETVEAGAFVVDGSTQPTLAVFSTNSGYAPTGTCWAAYGGNGCVTWVPAADSPYYAAMPLPTGTVSGVRQEITIHTQYVVITRSVRIDGMIFHEHIPIWELIVGLNDAAPVVMGYYLAQDFTGPMARGQANSFQLGGEIEDDSNNWTTPPTLDMGPGVALNSAGIYSKFETPDQSAYHRNYGYTGEPADGAIAGYGTRPCSYGPAPTVYPGYFFFGDIDATFVSRVQPE